ncbi:MAG TPA: hypothetical protein VKW04_05100 [Planctomycetota bacterium]|nr:hypothetical protein [Planctomycetota bacterium]
MEAPRQLATLAQQIDIVRRRADGDEAGGELALAFFHSLRTTYLAISTGLDPRKDATHLFLLLVSPSGEHLLLQGGQPVPVNGAHLASLFAGAGIELMPGQMLLLEPELAKESIEEALGRLALEQALADRERCRRRDALDDSLTLPPQEDLDALREAEERSNLLWDRKIDLVGASLVADEYVERARALLAPQDPENGMEAA